MIQPEFLREGDIVSIVAPGRKPDPAAIEAAVGILQSWGLRVQLGKNLFSAKHNYLSGTDDERLSDLQTALNDKTVRAVLCARGGYGTTRIIDRIDFSEFAKNPKWVCGFSDITALHLKLQSLAIQSIHSLVPIQFSKHESADSLESLRKVLFGENTVIKTKPQTDNKMGFASGELAGGNLSLLVESLGTSSEVITKNKILVIEEVDEYVYRVDRMLVQLKRAGKLDTLAGLIIGYMTDIKEGELPFQESVEQIVRRLTHEFSYPVAFGFPIGHENPNLAWIEGRLGELTISNEQAVLKF